MAGLLSVLTVPVSSRAMGPAEDVSDHGSDNIIRVQRDASVSSQPSLHINNSCWRRYGIDDE